MKKISSLYTRLFCSAYLLGSSEYVLVFKRITKGLEQYWSIKRHIVCYNTLESGK